MPVYSDLSHKRGPVTLEEIRREEREAVDARERNKPFCFQKPLPEAMVDVPNFMDKLRAMFEYEPETGLLYYAFMQPHQENRCATNRVGMTGYGRVKFWDFSTSSANLVFLLHHGRWPTGRLKRRNGDVSDDRIGNLYEPTAKRVGSLAPQFKPDRKNKSRGVARCGPNHWQAYCKVEGRQINLGRFGTEAEAIARRQAWERGDDLV